mmetsp:Transcript_29481/g.50907  ORF Transcript_29481/g.50907 Transcript_29481/m.50907 type:complete len:283 (-) Transcript_29481:51-899(-)
MEDLPSEFSSPLPQSATPVFQMTLSQLLELLSSKDSSPLGDLAKESTSDIHFMLMTPPCNNFTGLNRFKVAQRGANVLEQCAMLVALTRPWTFMFENVPTLQRDKALAPFFEAFVGSLLGLGYHVSWSILKCSDHGVPQDRERLFLLGSRAGEVPVFPPPIQAGPRTVEEALHEPLPKPAWKAKPVARDSRSDEQKAVSARSPAQTVTSCTDSSFSSAALHYKEPRVWYAEELMRFQGLPDCTEIDAECELQARKQISGALPPAAAYHISAGLLDGVISHLS